MGMFLFDCGVMKFPRSIIIQDNEARDQPECLLSVPLEAFLIEQKDGLVLFDTGCDPEGKQGKWPHDYCQIPFEEHYLPERLREIGIHPSDIKTVVASHLHFDHAGCLHMFKNAQIIVSEVEYVQTFRAYEAGSDLNAHLVSDIHNWLRANLTWTKISPDIDTYQLANGVTIINLGSGHSWGMLGMLVALASGTYLLVSDAIYTKANQGPPEKFPSMISDIEGYRKAIKRIRSYAQMYNATIIYGHDFAQFNSLLDTTGGYIK